jgi:hypothetical protein
MKIIRTYCTFTEQQVRGKESTYRAGAARAVQDAAGLVLLPSGLELPAHAGAGTGAAGSLSHTTGSSSSHAHAPSCSPTSGGRVAVLVDAAGTSGAVAVLSLVLHAPCRTTN